jgi:hypothetical protein
MVRSDARAYRGLAPGWYRDLNDPSVARYWDGTTLGDERRPLPPPESDATEGTPAPPAAPPPPTAPPPPPDPTARPVAPSPPPPGEEPVTVVGAGTGEPTPPHGASEDAASAAPVGPVVVESQPRWSRTVSTVLKVTAWLVLVVGLLSSAGSGVQLHRDGSSAAHIAAVVAVVFFGAIVTAAACAFFAYALDLLMRIEANTRVRPN